MKILILGHKGMLGHVVFKYFKNLNFDIETIEEKFPTNEFCKKIINSDCDYIINCIGCIPQKTTSASSMMLANFFLPVFLSQNFKRKVIHATTDCEFSGNSTKLYSKESIKDATDIYGRSKILGSDYITDKQNCYIIRTSIIGFELYGKKSLLEWFLNNDSKVVTGFSDHWWNGITTLEWAKVAHKIIDDKIKNNFIQIGSNPVSKFDLLNIFNDVFEVQKNIVENNTGQNIFKCLQSDFEVETIKNQIVELKNWY